MTRYAKRRNELNRQTVESSETLQGVKTFVAEKSSQASERITSLMRVRRGLSMSNNIKKKFSEDFMTL